MAFANPSPALLPTRGRKEDVHFRNSLSFTVVIFKRACETTSELHLNKRKKNPTSIISEQISWPVLLQYENSNRNIFTAKSIARKVLWSIFLKLL